MTINMAIKYWLARILGSLEGINSPEKARETILADVRRAKSELNVVSCTADLTYWNDEVISEIESKLRRKPSVKIEFLIGPDMNNSRLEKLAREGKIKLIKLTYKPPCDCRIVDNRDTYLSNHGGDGRPRKYSWTFGNRPALDDRIKYYNSLKRVA